MSTHPNKALDTTFATIGAVCWSVQLIPQLIKSYRRKDTAGLSSHMLFIWIVGGTFLGGYAFLQDLSIPLLIQPQLFCFFAALAWGQCMYYDQKKSKFFAITTTSITIALVGAFEACFVLTGRLSHKAVTAYGVLSAIFIVVGLLPQFWEVYKFKAVIGVSLVFLFVDFSGAVFSTLSLIFAEGEFDTLAAVNYAAVGVLELAIFALVPILNPAHWRRVREQQRRDEEAMTQSDGGELAASKELAERREGAEVAPGAVEEGRLGRTTSVGSRPVSERGPLGWMDEGVAIEEERRREAEEARRKEER